MTWTVLSDRLRWAAGTKLEASDLEGCNIPALVTAGHLRPTKTARAVTEDDQNGA